MKLHIGSGSVYLRGYVNVDVQAPKTFLASDRPDLVERLATTDDDYYARHKDKDQDALRDGPLNQEYVCDVFGSFADLPVSYWCVDEVLSRHCFEHLSITEARAALSSLDAAMKVNAVLRIDVPDHEETLKLLRETGDEFYVRHLLGPRRDERGFHMMSYTRASLIALVEEYGFRFDAEEPNIHFYPAFCLRFVKSQLRAPREYALPPYPFKPGWKVIDVGPGRYPLHRADMYFDRDPEVLGALALGDGQRACQLDISEAGSFDGVPDKWADYAFCSHVLEHVDDPRAVCRTLSRIAKRGTIVMPSVVKESLFCFEEPTHKWLVMPNPDNNGSPIFVKQNEKYIRGLKDIDVMKIMSRMFRTGPNRVGEEQKYLRKWFAENERKLDVIVHWEGSIDVVVVE